MQMCVHGAASGCVSPLSFNTPHARLSMWNVEGVLKGHLPLSYNPTSCVFPSYRTPWSTWSCSETRTPLPPQTTRTWGPHSLLQSQAPPLQLPLKTWALPLLLPLKTWAPPFQLPLKTSALSLQLIVQT